MFDLKRASLAVKFYARKHPDFRELFGHLFHNKGLAVMFVMFFISGKFLQEAPGNSRSPQQSSLKNMMKLIAFRDFLSFNSLPLVTTKSGSKTFNVKVSYTRVTHYGTLCKTDAKSVEMIFQ